MEKGLRAAVLFVFVLGVLYGADAETQEKKVPRVGFVSTTGTPRNPLPLFDAFRLGLRELGYIESKNVVIEHRHAEGRLDRMPLLVKELVQQRVDVLVAVNNVLIRAAKEATKTIPVVMVSSVDPVAAGYIESFAHPGGNITGLAWLGRDLSAKRIELLKEMIPKISRVGILWDADGPGPAVAVKEYEGAARAFKIGLQSLEVRGPNPDLVGAFQVAKTARAEALIIVGNALMFQHASQIFELAIKNRLPSITELERYVRAGGLISYGASLTDLYRRAGTYVGRILKGEKPADMLVEQPSVFEMFINLKTAKQLDLEVPRRVLLRANEVIE
jgi:putative ABC transport system substrate-binding protein